MKAKNIHITCNSAKERNDVFGVLLGLGFSHYGYDGGTLDVQLRDNDGCFRTWVKEPMGEQLTYNQFMEKYAMTELQKTIEAAKKQGYTNKTLSNALGKYDGYIARIISKPQSEKLQKFLTKEINELLVPAQIDDAIMISKQEYDELQGLRKELDHKNQVLDKRNDKYNLLEGEFNELKSHFDKQTKNSEKLIEANGQLVLDKEGLIRTINELEQQNKRVVDSNFELNDAISVRDATIKNLNQNLNVSREDCNMRASMHITSENKRKKERFWFAGVTIALLVLFVISHLV